MVSPKVRQALLTAIKALSGEMVSAASDKIGKIYVAHLGDYVGGKLRGGWFEPSSDPEDIWESINQALGVSEGEDFEWAFHDYDGFPDLGENPDIDDVAQVVELMEEHGTAATKAAMGYAGKDLDHAKDMLENGFAEFSTTDEDKALEEYAEQLAEEGVLDKEFLLQYVDFDRVGRDLGIGDYTAVSTKDGTFIFRKV